MHRFYSARIFIVDICVMCTKSFNILFYNGHIVLNYATHFVYSPRNSYVYIHLILDFKYILLLIISTIRVVTVKARFGGHFDTTVQATIMPSAL